LNQHVPAAARHYGVELWREAPFDFRLSAPRESKAGDFCARPGRPNRITVNRDLPPFSFLITYIHEVAHHRVFLQHGWRAEAHGAQWKQMFKNLMAPVLTEAVFPEPLLSGLQKHMANPRATTCADTHITALLRSHDPRAQQWVLLSELPAGSLFRLRHRWFIKGETKRTRVLCREHRTRRAYLVPADTPVGPAQLPLL
jgi:hypothetical protein